jgi:hypothetical protein
MMSPLFAAERRTAHALAGRAVHRVFVERFGRGWRRSRPLYDLDTFEVLSVFADVEQELGVTFTDDDIEFIETEGELVSRAAAALMRAGS